MHTSTRYYSHPIYPNDLPYVKEGKSLDDRVSILTGNFFQYHLSVFLHLVEKTHQLCAEKITLKGSCVPIILQLSEGPSEELNDIDLQITFAKLKKDPAPGQELDESSFSSYIESETIFAVHKMTMKWLQLSYHEKSRPPLCRAHLGYCNVQVRNPAKSSPIDLSLKFKQPIPTPLEPDAISTKDGFEIAIKYAQNGTISFEISQSAFISKFSSISNSMGLFRQHLFTVPPDYMAKIRNGLLILLRYEMKKWNFVSKANPNDPESEIYEKGDLSALESICFKQFLEQYRNGLDNLKLAQALYNFLNNHFSNDSTQAAILLGKLLFLTHKYANEPSADIIAAKKIITNINTCIDYYLYYTVANRSEPSIAQLKKKAKRCRQILKLLQKIELNKNIQNAEELSAQVNNHSAKIVDAPLPFNPEIEQEEKNPEIDVKLHVPQKVSKKRSIYLPFIL